MDMVGDALPAGTLVRVHTGSSADDAAPAPEVDHRYVPATGGAATRRLPGASGRVRIVDTAGDVLHEREFLRSEFANQTFRILRSRDGTRALLFIESGGTAVGEMPTGTLRLAWTFRRNVAGLPILRRMGSNRQESTAVDLVVVQL